MEAKLARLTHKLAIQLHLVIVIPFAVLAPGGQSGNCWIHPRICKYRTCVWRTHVRSCYVLTYNFQSVL